MKNKKGDLTTEEILKIILAVIGISILFYLAYQMYAIFGKDSELEKVKSYANELEKIIKDIEEGENKELMILGLEKWAVTGWPFDPGIFSGEKIPDRCLLEGWSKCICFFGNWDSWENSYAIDRFNRGKYKDLCDKRGVCFDVSDFSNLVVDSTGSSNINDGPICPEKSIINMGIKLENGELKIWKKK